MKNFIFLNSKAKIIISLILATAIFVSVIFFGEYKKSKSNTAGIYDLTAYTKDSCVSLNWNVIKAPFNSQIELTITSNKEEKIVLLNKNEKTFDFIQGEHGVYYSFGVHIKDKNDYVGESAEAKAMFIKNDALGNLPLLKIDTYNGLDPTTDFLYPPEGAVGVTSTNNEYVYGSLSLEENGEVCLQGDMQIKIRGNSTSFLTDKKPYKIKFNTPKNMLEPQNNDNRHKEWILFAYEKNLRTIVGSKLSEMMGMEWTAQYKYVNLILNGDYKGCYMIIQPIDHFEQKLNPDSSGFIIENDAYWWAENGMYFKSKNLISSMGYTFKLPSGDKITQAQQNNIKDYILMVEDLIFSGNPACFDYIDEQSFASWLLIQDILGVSDGSGTNMFIYKKELELNNPLSSELKMGPLWDFNTAFEMPNQWSTVHSHNIFYFPKLLELPQFESVYKEKWNSISDNLELEIANHLNNIISQQASSINESWRLDSIRWQTTNDSFEETCHNAQLWLSQQMCWIDSAIEDLQAG